MGRKMSRFESKRKNKKYHREKNPNQTNHEKETTGNQRKEREEERRNLFKVWQCPFTDLVQSRRHCIHQIQPRWLPHMYMTLYL